MSTQTVAETLSFWLQEAYEDGAVIAQQGEPGDCMFVVQSGEVIARHRATGDMGSGTEVRLAQAYKVTKRPAFLAVLLFSQTSSNVLLIPERYCLT